MSHEYDPQFKLDFEYLCTKIFGSNLFLQTAYFFQYSPEIAPFAGPHKFLIEILNITGQISPVILRISMRNFDRMTSYDRLHSIANRATPKQICQYKHALLLHKIYNDIDQGADWLALNFNQNFNSRISKFITTDTNNFKTGNNVAFNRL